MGLEKGSTKEKKAEAKKEEKAKRPPKCR